MATFDGDNHIVAIQDNSGGTSYYTYNANGQRVRRKIATKETWQIYGIDGELVDEYAANGAAGSTTVYNGKGERIDVENPNPGQRAGQIHYQSGKTKLLYDPNSKSFIGASKSLNKRLMNDPQIQNAIKKGLKILGESQ